MVELKLTNTQAYMIAQLLIKNKHQELKRIVHTAIRKSKLEQGNTNV